MGKILIPQEIAGEGVQMLKDAGHRVVIGCGLSEEELSQAVRDCDAVLLRTAQVSKKVLEAGAQLKIVARHGAGYNNVDIQAAAELGIWVTNTPDATTNAVAEFTLGAILAAGKRIGELGQAMKAGDFYAKNRCKGMEMAGKTLGIIGLGRIGRAVAKKAYYGLDMQVMAFAHGRSRQDAPEYVTLADWETVFSQADVITLHVPLNESTRGFVGQREFAMMKKGAYFINCARGEVVQEKALIQALQEGEIAGAFCDVFAQEPPAGDNPLLSMRQVTVTPHMASNTEECMKTMACQAASQIIRVLAGERPDWPVNAPVGVMNVPGEMMNVPGEMMNVPGETVNALGEMVNMPGETANRAGEPEGRKNP